MRIDMHIHTDKSPDAISPIKNLVRTARKKNIRGLAITDHNYFHRTKEKYPDFILLYGCEVSTDLGHMIVLNLEGVPSNNAEEIVEYAKKNSGITIPTHPFSKYKFGMGEKAFRIGATAIEKYNGTDPLNNLISKGRIKNGTGGSDAHSSSEVGLCWTEFDDGLEKEEDILEAIRKGRFKGCVSSNPFSLPVGYLRRKMNKK